MTSPSVQAFSGFYTLPLLVLAYKALHKTFSFSFSSHQEETCSNIKAIVGRTFSPFFYAFSSTAKGRVGIPIGSFMIKWSSTPSINPSTNPCTDPLPHLTRTSDDTRAAGWVMIWYETWYASGWECRPNNLRKTSAQRPNETIKMLPPYT